MKVFSNNLYNISNIFSISFVVDGNVKNTMQTSYNSRAQLSNVVLGCNQQLKFTALPVMYGLVGDVTVFEVNGIRYNTRINLLIIGGKRELLSRSVLKVELLTKAFFLRGIGFLWRSGIVNQKLYKSGGC